MISRFSTASGQCLTTNKLEYSIRRNFGGIPRAVLNTMACFDEHLNEVKTSMAKNSVDEPPLDPVKMIETSLSGCYTKGYVETNLLSQ